MAASEPAASFPTAAEGDAELEATYRFLNNEAVSAAEIMRPHLHRTVERCGAATAVVVAHDTTEFNFGRSKREDLGRVGRGKSFGFYGHVALAVANGELRRPLGVLGFAVHRRDGTGGRAGGHKRRQEDPRNEFRRWLELVAHCEQQLGVGAAIHVMDREADSYALMASLVEHNSRFVVRMAGAKRVTVAEELEPQTVGEAMARAGVVATRQAELSTRGHSAMPSFRKTHPQRRARTAQLQISATRVTLARPQSSNRCRHKTLTLNVVHVLELAPPEGEPAVEWRLWTTEPVETAAQVLAVVDAYRCRWMIEEYFKALKSGCAIESRQLESHDGLVNTVALYVPIAWRLLMLRTLSHDDARMEPATARAPMFIPHPLLNAPGLRANTVRAPA